MEALHYALDRNAGRRDEKPPFKLVLALQDAYGIIQEQLLNSVGKCELITVSGAGEFISFLDSFLPDLIFVDLSRSQGLQNPDSPFMKPRRVNRLVPCIGIAERNVPLPSGLLAKRFASVIRTPFHQDQFSQIVRPYL